MVRAHGGKTGWQLVFEDHLTREAHEFLMNKSQEERKRLSRVFKLLSGRFGSAQNQRQARMDFSRRYMESLVLDKLCLIKQTEQPLLTTIT